jgi:raffinose/stachyose/melibiose transport system permease protein
MLSNKKAIILFTAPALFVFTLIVFYPILQTVYYSFFNWDGLSTPIFTGLKNYSKLFQDPLFYQSTLNGLIFAAVLVVFQIGIATVLSFALLRQNIPFRRFFRSSYFIPVVLSVTVVCQLWSAIYDPSFGLLNKLFAAIGIPFRQQWLSNPHEPVAILAVAFVNMWECAGYQFAIIYAGVKSIPAQYHEAARIDGATEFQLDLHILMPMLSDTFRMCLIIAITGGINAYAHINLMTAGGPGTATYTLTYMTFRSAFVVGKYGYGCTVSVALVIQCILAMLIVNRVFDRRSVTY